MNPYMITFLGIVAVMVILFIIEKTTGHKIYPYIVSGKPVVSAVSLLAKALSATTSNSYLEVISIVAQAAVDGTDHAEQLWLDGDIPKEERAAYCHTFIVDTLKGAGIEPTEKIMAIADGFITIACALLPHGLAPNEVTVNE